METRGDRTPAPPPLLLPGSCSSLQRKRRSAVGGVEEHQQPQVRLPALPPLAGVTAISRSPGSLQRQRDNKHTKNSHTIKPPATTQKHRRDKPRTEHSVWFVGSLLDTAVLHGWRDACLQGNWKSNSWGGAFKNVLNKFRLYSFQEHKQL